MARICARSFRGLSNMRAITTLLVLFVLWPVEICMCFGQQELMDVPAVESSWDDLLEGVDTREEWRQRKQELRQKFLELIRDQHKPERPELDFEVHGEVIVDQLYRRQLVSYSVGPGERAHAYLGIPISDAIDQFPAVVALHGTFAEGKDRAAGLVDNPDKAYLDHLCRRGYVVIAPDHFVAGHRIPELGPYDTTEFHERHPDWTSVGKFTFEHSIAIDALESLPFVDAERIGAMGHSLGGQGTMFLAAYDERVKAAACNCAASFFRHNPRVLDWSRDRWYVYLKHLRPDLLKGQLPEIDFHHIMALASPRAYLDVAAINDGNVATQRQRVLMLMKVMQVYELEGVPQQFAFYIHGKGHAVPHESRELIYGFMDSILRPETTVTRLVETLNE